MTITKAKALTRADIAAIEDPAAPRRVAEYFETFTGRWFERLAGGGDRPATAHRLTADDLVAVSMLSIRMPAGTAIALLVDRAAEIDALLAQVPVGLDLWDADDDVIGPGSPAAELWTLLRDVPGSGWVTAGKLLARKRPRLVPVYDTVVRQVVGRRSSDRWWLPLRDLLRDDPTIRRRLAAVRAASGVGDDISLLRILDVVLWRAGQDGIWPER